MLFNDLLCLFTCKALGGFELELEVVFACSEPLKLGVLPDLDICVSCARFTGGLLEFVAALKRAPRRSVAVVLVSKVTEVAILPGTLGSNFASLVWCGMATG